MLRLQIVHTLRYHNNIACLDCNKFVLLNTMINLLILLLHLSASIHHQDKQRVLVLVFSNSSSCLLLCAKYKKLHKLEKHKKDLEKLADHKSGMVCGLKNFTRCWNNIVMSLVEISVVSYCGHMFKIC